MKKLIIPFLLIHNGYASEGRELKSEEVTITTVEFVGNADGTWTKNLNTTQPETLKPYQEQPRADYYPEKEGFFTQVVSASDPNLSLPVYFQPAPSNAVSSEQKKGRKLCIGTTGFQGQGRDVGPHLGSFPEYDKLVIGCNWDKDPTRRLKEGSNLRSSNLVSYFTDRKTFSAGGPVSRIVYEAQTDFDYLLDHGAIFIHPDDGSTFTVDLNDYDEVVVVAQCYSYWSWIELLKNRAEQKKSHPISALFADSAMTGFSDTWPDTVGIRTLGKKMCYSVLPALTRLEELQCSVPTFFVTGDKVQCCHYNNTVGNQEMLKRSGPESKLVTIASVAQVRPMYNGTQDDKVLGTREAVGGMVSLWLAQLPKNKSKRD